MEHTLKTSKHFELISDKIPEKFKNDIQKSYICLKNHGCKTVYLFGSLVTGEAHYNSDIDIGIKGLPPELFLEAYSDLSDTLENTFDLVDFDFSNDFYSLLKRMGEVVEIG
jgi:predicted nucleotidyltransferase